MHKTINNEDKYSSGVDNSSGTLECVDCSGDCVQLPDSVHRNENKYGDYCVISYNCTAIQDILRTI